ncbi:TlpA family protein disulfide reductase [Cohnella sp. 56]|uniref:TlpA family protein disulfide reductase n=1 Tax=Cohnella sp. 56 TaxID=3113722 RepID=UPI0030E87D16
MNKKWIVFGAAAILLAAAMYVSSSFSEDGSYAQVRQERQTLLGGRDSGEVSNAGVGSSALHDEADSSAHGDFAGGSSRGDQAGDSARGDQAGGPADVPAADEALEEAPDFTLTDLDGNTVSLRDLRGKTVYLNFWTTWCKWCKKEMPAMKQVYQAFEDKNLAIVAVDIGEDREEVASYIAKGSYPFQVLLDSDKSVSESYRVTSIPVSVFVDKEGRVAYRKLGTMKEDEMRAVIASLVQ